MTEELDDRVLRDQIAEDYHANSRRLGGEISMEDARSLASDDLQLVDAFEREVRPNPPKSKIVEELPDETPALAEQMAAEAGDRFEKREVGPDAPLVETLGHINYEKRMKLTGRIHEISMRDDSGDYCHPALAAELSQIHANWTFGVREFASARTQAERDKRFFGMLERLCDKSNGRIRPAWWVK